MSDRNLERVNVKVWIDEGIRMMCSAKGETEIETLVLIRMPVENEPDVFGSVTTIDEEDEMLAMLERFRLRVVSGEWKRDREDGQ